MTRYLFTPQAARDLFDIWDYIARDSPRAADKVEEAISLACGFASDGYGAQRPDLIASAVWVVSPYPNYLIVYDPEKKPLRIVRIIHGKRLGYGSRSRRLYEYP